MNRRDFLKYLLATPIAAEFDVEKLLWVKEKVIFVPSPAQIAFLTDEWITYEFNMYVTNPSKCAYINNIVEPRISWIKR